MTTNNDTPPGLDSPEWQALCDATAKAAAETLGCMVALVAFPVGGMALSIEGKPESGPLAAMAEHPQKLFRFLADIADPQTQMEPPGLVPGKPLEVVVAPGAFDAFEGSPEELASVLADFKSMAAQGRLHEMSKPMSAADFQELADHAREHEERLAAQGTTKTRQ